MKDYNRGRVAPSPPPPFMDAAPRLNPGPYPWNAPRQAIGLQERSLTRAEYLQGQGILLRIEQLPRFIKNIIQGRFDYLLKNQGLPSANRYLMLTVAKRLLPRLDAVTRRSGINTAYSSRFLSEADNYRLLPDMSDKKVGQFAEHIASQLNETYEALSDEQINQNGGDKDILFTDKVQVVFFAQIAGMARSLNVIPVHWRSYRSGALTMRRAVASICRLVNDQWWKRQLIAQRDRWREALLIAVGQVHRNASPYASKSAIREVRARRQANMEYLKRCEIENVETGERFDLIEKFLSSVSNPEIRRMELMNTIAGIEKYACQKKDIGMFITITTPSKYHPHRITGKGKNQKVLFNRAWDDHAFTPKDGQRYLVKLWGNIRTAFKDQGLKVYGMRVVEPHHDGTPHWHMMLFTQKQHRQQVIDIMRAYALREDGTERGAAKNRFDCKHLNRGGATGYIAKYIAKNIDGYALDREIDHETGKPLKDAAAAVSAWASTWRIPQFRPIGLPTMGAYRECRRIRKTQLNDNFDDAVEAVRAAADSGNFAAYIELQGGANIARDLQTVRVATIVRENPNEYDEETQKVVGIYAPHLGSERVYKTRTTEWRIVEKSTGPAPLTLESGSAAPWSPVNNCGLPLKTLKINDAGTLLGTVHILEDERPPIFIDWKDDEIVACLARYVRKAQKQHLENKTSHSPPIFLRAPSARLTHDDKRRMVKIKTELNIKGISLALYEIEALARGAKVKINNNQIQYNSLNTWGY
ncbi:replication endonuclease [Sodalis sp. dw_96]|uniref:replication endonuclease n=1 Tax=Sodalis sp. dw_96 TaxID=2719794 RepID=UPI001BD3BB32|nr:replication endonuclease [Sodalis sp. dw_96]